MYIEETSEVGAASEPRETNVSLMMNFLSGRPTPTEARDAYGLTVQCVTKMIQHLGTGSLVGSRCAIIGAGVTVTGRVLLVDDDPVWLDAAVRLLKNAGYTARGATSFTQAQAELDSFRPDLLITDIRLREYNGLYLLVRSKQHFPEMVCLIVSGYDDPVLERDARQQGAFDFLIKPVEPSHLLARAADALASRGKRRWPRKLLLAGDVPATIAGTPINVVDVSYGGVRLHLPVDLSIADPLELDVPAVGGRVLATPVWSDHDATASYRACGAWLHLVGAQVDAWKAIVDQLPATTA
jgi:CheY-like chemotaxis protein